MDIRIGNSLLTRRSAYTIKKNINSVAEAEIHIPNYGGFFSNKFTGGESVVIEYNNTILFSGKIVEIDIGVEEVRVIAFDNLYFASNTYPTYDTIYGTVFDIIQQMTNIKVTGTIAPEDIKMTHEIDTSKTILDNIRKICNLYNYRFFYNSTTDLINIKSNKIYGKNDVNYNILWPSVMSPIKAKTITLLSSEVKYNYTEMYNRVRVSNKERSFIYNDALSQQEYFVSEAFPITTDEDDIEYVAKAFIDTHKFPKIEASVDIIPHDIDLLDVVYLDDGKYGLATLPNNIIEIIGLEFKMDNSFTISITLGDLNQMLTSYLQ